MQHGVWPQPKKDFIPRLRDHRGHGEGMQAKTVGQQTRNRNLVIPARTSRGTFLRGLCGLCGEFPLPGRRRRWPLALQMRRELNGSATFRWRKWIRGNDGVWAFAGVTASALSPE